MNKPQSILKQDWKYLLVLTLIILLFFLPVFTKGWVIFPDLLNKYQPWAEYLPDLGVRYLELRSDLVDSYIPKFNFVKTSIQNGNVPLWYDIADLGKPASQYAAQFLFSPFNLFMWLLPVDIGFTIGTILKTLVAGIGMFYWLKSLGVNRTLSVGGGIVFVFSGFNVGWFLAPAATQNLMLPWVFLLTDYILSSKTNLQRFWRMISLGILLSTILFTGFIAGAGYTFYLLGLYVLIRTIVLLVRSRPRTIASVTNVLFPGIMILGSMVIALGLAAVFLLPSIEWVEVIDVSYRKVSNASTSLPLKTLLQMGLPNIFGNPVFKNWRGVFNWVETSSFVTILALIASPIGIFYAIRKKQAPIIVLSGLAILCGLIIWDISPLLSMVRHLPILDSSSSVRLLGPLTFFVITIGLSGLNEVVENRKLRFISSYLVIVLVLLSAYAVYKYQFINQAGLINPTITDYEPFVFSTVLFALVLLIFFFIANWLYRKNYIKSNVLSIVINLMLLFDIGLFMVGQIPFVPREYFYPRTEQTDFLQENLENGRLLIFDNLFLISGTQIYYQIDTALTHNLHTAREKELVEMFSQGAWGSVTSPMLQTERTDFSSPVIDFYGVKYVVIGKDQEIDDPTWRLVLANVDGADTYENLEWSNQPYQFSAHFSKLTSLEDFENNLEAVSRGEHIYYESESSTLPEAKEVPEADSKIVVITDTADYNEIEVCTDQPGILTVRDSYWPGWNVSVNGEPATVLQTNFVYRGVYLEEGCNRIVEEYLPESFEMGKLISTISLCGIILLTLLGLIFKKKNTKGIPPGQ